MDITITLNDKERAHLLHYCITQLESTRDLLSLLKNGNVQKILDDEAFIFWSNLSQKLS